jgi:hypothetical protein
LGITEQEGWGESGDKISYVIKTTCLELSEQRCMSRTIKLAPPTSASRRSRMLVNCPPPLHPSSTPSSPIPNGYLLSLLLVLLLLSPALHHLMLARDDGLAATRLHERLIIGDSTRSVRCPPTPVSPTPSAVRLPAPTISSTMLPSAPPNAPPAAPPGYCLINPFGTIRYSMNLLIA